MKELNEERVKGGLVPITIAQLIREVREHLRAEKNDNEGLA